MTELEGPVFVRTDGSVRSSDHPDGPSATIGYVIDVNGDIIDEDYEDVSSLTDSSSVAEYIALDRALRRLHEMGFEDWVFVKTDSQNLADLLNGANPRTRESQEWIDNVRMLAEGFEGYTVSKTDRETTEAAHQLARRGHT